MFKNFNCGVYKITNLITNKFYIGCSSNIKRRWADHKQRYIHYNKEYDKALYIDMRKYEIKNFHFTVLEYCKEEDLFKREKFSYL